MGHEGEKGEHAQAGDEGEVDGTWQSRPAKEPPEDVKQYQELIGLRKSF
jgi:hypothetical protein